MSDDVYPVHYYDDDSMLRSIMVHWTFVFNDVLNAETLHNALRRLLEMDGWRKYGGRLRLNVSSNRRDCSTGIFQTIMALVHIPST